MKSRPIAFGSLCLALALLVGGRLASPQTGATNGRIDPVALMRDVSYNELKRSDAPRVRYEIQTTDDKGIRVDEVIETPLGDLKRHLGREGKPLTPEQEHVEEARLNNLYAHPEIQERRHQKEQEDSDRADGFIKLLPDAFLYEYQGTVQGLSGPAYRLTFKPNPNFHPPSAEAQVFHGMAGEVWVDVKQKRLSRFDAHIIEDVNFGWGVAIRLYKGGTMFVEQVDAGGGRWEQKHFKLNLTGKILMIKSMTRQESSTESHYVEVPAGTDYKGAIDILRSLPPAFK